MPEPSMEEPEVTNNEASKTVKSSKSESCCWQSSVQGHRPLCQDIVIYKYNLDRQTYLVTVKACHMADIKMADNGAAEDPR